MSNVDPEFGRRLRALRISRNQCGCSQLALASDAGLRVSHFSDIERGQRPCGPEVASRLASALGLQGDNLVEFMRLAAATTERGHLFVSSPDFGDLLDIIVRRLRRQGIDERRIVSVSAAPSASRAEAGDALVVLVDGTRAFVEINVRVERATCRPLGR